MSKPWIKKLTRISPVAGISILAILASAIDGCKKPGAVFPPEKPHVFIERTGPPVIVVGGSIRGDSYGQSGQWSNTNCGVSDPLEYCALTNGSTNFLASFLYEPEISETSMPPGTQPGHYLSWTIQITDQDANGHENKNAGVLLCGNAACNPMTDSDSSKVYIRPVLDDQGHSGWDTSSLPNSIFYIDRTCSTKGKCEHPVTATLYIGGSKVSDSQCKVPTKVGCFVSVGVPATSD